MILSLNFLKDYIDLDENIDVLELANKMTLMGNEYDSAGKLIDVNNLVIGKIISCDPHPDSDHLHVCKVDIGKEILQIVCGAPNVEKGQKIILALPGAKLPKGEIKKSVIRGIESNGMICSLGELGIDNKFLNETDKIGIHILDNDAILGEDPIEYMKLNDSIIDFDLTANRGDLLSILGMAYEVGAIYGKKVKTINLEHRENSNDVNNILKIKIDTENCKLFLAKEVKNAKIAESPIEIREKLMASGIRPINNLVDISNYVMIETGQPLHFYDADKLNGLIQVRMAKENEKITTLDNKERELSNDDIIISDGTKPIGLAGVMGGLDTEITENTKNIIIESAIFDNVKVRKTSNKILRSEASNRFEKGLDPNRTYMAIERAAKLLEDLADAEVVGGTCIFDKTNKEEKKIRITCANISNILGKVICEKEIINIFEKLGFNAKVVGKDNSNGIDSKYNNELIESDVERYSSEQNDIIEVEVPTRRIDIEIKEDLIEEIGRVYGVDRIDGREIKLAIKRGNFDRTTRNIKNKLFDLGLNETLSYALVSKEESNMFTNNEDKKSIQILSPLSEDRKFLRQTVITSLYKIYKYNNDRKNENVNIFEIAKSFYTKDNEYFEENKLAVLMKGDYYTGIKNLKVDFYVIKGIAEEILDFLGYSNRYSFIVDDRLPKELHPGKSSFISVNNDIVGNIGRITPVLCSDEVYVLEINLEKLLNKKVTKMKYSEISKFPVVKKDISLIVDNDINVDTLQKVIKSNGGKILISSKVFDLYNGKGIQEGKKSIAFTLELGSSIKTLTDEEITNTINKIVDGLAKKCHAELRD